MLEKKIDLCGNTLKIETGQVARQSAGSVLVTYGETTILCAVNAAKTVREDVDFFPLQVDYRERHYAAGKIPGGFFKREARPSEKEILTSRLTDRPIRPLFPKSFKFETQVIITALSSDGENPPDVLAGIGASTALMISDIPWNGPIATVRVGQIDGKFVINPTNSQMENSRMELIVSGNFETIVMVEGEADEISEEELVSALKTAHEMIVRIIDLQNAFVEELTIQKRPVPEEDENKELEKNIETLVQDKINVIIKTADKLEREKATEDLYNETQEALYERYPELDLFIKNHIDSLFKTAFRKQIVTDGVRSDGRKTDTIRDISIKPSFLPRVHGSVLFTRGETQALAVLTLGAKSDEQIIDTMGEDYKKNYYLHYNFPPYSVGEVGRIGFTGRREIGHGNLAERSLKTVLPNYDDFPYTIRIVSEILESNGSSSMASVCGGSLVLMNAGIPTKRHVSGIAMGLVLEDDQYAILSDISGAEDHYGDMDFKVAGTINGITAIQLDLKIAGISFKLLAEALGQAKEGRLHIINIMNAAQPEPNELSKYAPRIVSLQINPEKIGALIGPSGKNIKKIIEDTECEINVENDGMVTVANPDAAKCNDAIELIKAITMEPEVGQEFDAIVSRLMTFGAFVEFAPGREGLVHISELDWKRTEKVEDVVKSGDRIKVKLIKIDDQGRLDFSRKSLLPKPDGYVKPSKHFRNDGKRGNRKPFKKRRF